LIEEEEFRSTLSVAQRILDVYGRCEASDSLRMSHTDGEMSFSRKGCVIDIFFRGSLVFRHDPNGEMTDFFEVHGIWIDEIEGIAQSIPSSSSGIASQR